jgi:RimJ/RimL family protein N-acetyltransferase
MNPSTLVTVRPMTEADARAVIEMHAIPARDGFVRPPRLEQVLRALADPERANRIVEAEGRTVGMLLASRLDGWLVEFDRIVISEPGHGYGRAAVEWVKHLAFAEWEAHRLYLEVVADNERARRLYERAGFVLEGTWRDGFRCPDGTFRDLCGYGMLAQEARPTAESQGE